MDDTWEAWHKSFLKAKNNFLKQGVEVIEIVVDIDELVFYCRSKGLKNDGATRAEFVQSK